MQLTDMANTTSGIVDPTLIQDTIAWLDSRRDGQGGFLRSPEALDSFGKAPANVTDAYILWALTSVNTSDQLNLTMEINALA